MLLCIALLAPSATAQYTKIDASLEQRLMQLHNSQQRVADHTSPASQEEVFVTLAEHATLPKDKLEALGGSVVMNLTSSLYIVDIPADSVMALSCLDEVKYIEQTTTTQTLNDLTCAATHANQVIKGTNLPTAFTGKDVLVGIIDRGFDFNHIAFHDAQGNSRIKCIFVPKNLILNQDPALYEDLQPFLDESGSVFAIDDPQYFSRLTTDDASLSHGTHVAGTASASNCIENIPYGGMAPEADIVLAVCPSATNSNAILATMCKLLSDYAKKQEKPMVVNISLGHNGGPHDGTDAIPTAITELLDGGNRPGLVFVIASGNEGNIPLGIETEMPIDGLRTCVVPERLSENSYLYWQCPVEVWSDDNTPIDFRYFLYDTENQQEVLTSPMFSQADFLATGQSSKVVYMNEAWEIAGLSQEDFTTLGIAVSLSWGTSSSNNRFNINYKISASMDSTHVIGIELKAPAGLKTSIYATGRFGLDDYDNASYTAGTYSAGYNSYCCSDAVISVGATVERTEVTNTLGISTEGKNGEKGEIANFSSWGTSINGVQIPTVVAPGAMIISPFNYYHEYHESTDMCSSTTTLRYSPGNSNSHPQLWGHLSGTSMAAPAVTGIIAEWLQACPTLTENQIDDVIKSSSQTFQSPNAVYGFGSIDALAGMKYIIEQYCGLRNIKANDPSIDEILNSRDIQRIDGTIISTTIPASQVYPTLPHGVYLIGGKKVIK